MKKSSKLPSQHLLSLDSQALAEIAGLEYVTDQMPGIQRKKKGEKFIYIGNSGKVIRDKEEIERIQALAIPPAYQDVWICSNRKEHLQATGRNAKGRKQYRYHARWREVSDETKYTKMLAFGQVLPLIRKQVQADLALEGMPSQKILAVVVFLLESTLELFRNLII